MSKKIKNDNLLEHTKVFDAKLKPIKVFDNKEKVTAYDKTSNKLQHVIPHPKGGWGVKKEGSLRPSKVFDQKEEAIAYAKIRTEKQNSTLVIHDINGIVLEKIIYNNDISCKGKKK